MVIAKLTVKPGTIVITNDPTKLTKAWVTATAPGFTNAELIAMFTPTNVAGTATPLATALTTGATATNFATHPSIGAAGTAVPAKYTVSANTVTGTVTNNESATAAITAVGGVGTFTVQVTADASDLYKPVNKTVTATVTPEKVATVTVVLTPAVAAGAFPAPLTGVALTGSLPNITCYSVTGIEWAGEFDTGANEGKFKASTTYTATLTLQAAANNTFTIKGGAVAEAAIGTITGSPTATLTVTPLTGAGNANNTATLKLVYAIGRKVKKGDSRFLAVIAWPLNQGLSGQADNGLSPDHLIFD